MLLARFFSIICKWGAPRPQRWQLHKETQIFKTACEARARALGRTAHAFLRLGFPKKLARPAVEV